MRTEFVYRDAIPTTHSTQVLAIGDPHFRIDNVEEIGTYIDRVEQLVVEHRPAFVVVMGDLLHCHERVHTTVLNQAYAFLARLRVHAPVYVLVGNHDYINNSQFLSDQHWMNALKEWDNITVVDTGAVLETPSGTFVFCPYVFPGRFVEALEHITPAWKKARAIFCHQEFYGCKMGAIQSTDGDRWDESLPFVIAGHVHDKQRIQSNVFYTGSSIQHAFGESSDKTVAWITFGETIAVSGVSLRLSRKQILYMDFDAIQTYTPVADDPTRIRITLSGTHEEFKVFRKSKKYKELSTANVKVVFKPTHFMEDVAHTETDDFYQILHDLLQSEKNPYLTELYHQLVPRT